jgi:succinyl-diaminopimelate desuccinylase
MATMRYEGLLSQVQEADVVSTCRDLVRFNTVNPPGDELEIAKYVGGVLREAGLTIEMISHSPTRASVVGRLKGSGEVPALMYNGHLDVVPVGEQEWLHDPFAGDVAEGKLWGRGSADMKGGVAAMIVATKVLASSDVRLRGDLILAATAGEEVNMMGARAVAAREDLGALQGVVIGEPTNNELCLGHRGVFWPEITTYGKTAHGSMPELGANAVMMMLALLSELDRMDIPYTPHPLVGEFTRSINTIAGGVKVNVVPDRCVATVDLRTVPGQDHQAILRQLEELIADLEQRIPQFRASIKINFDIPPAETSPDEPIVQRFADVMAEVIGERPSPKGVGFATEASIYVPALHVPTIICGPGQPGLAHQPNEYVEVEQLTQAAKVFILAAVQLLT